MYLEQNELTYSEIAIAKITTLNSKSKIVNKLLKDYILKVNEITRNINFNKLDFTENEILTEQFFQRSDIGKAKIEILRDLTNELYSNIMDI